MTYESSFEYWNDSDILTDREHLEFSWQGYIIEGEESEFPAMFAATNQRLMYSFGNGHFKDIGLKHIESVEVLSDKETMTEGTDPDVLIALGLISTVLGIGLIFFSGSSGLGILLGLVLSLFGGVFLWIGIDEYDDLKQELEVIEHTFYHILLKTSTSPIYIETEEDVGQKLSKLVRESQ